ncbi:LysR family transcriptional regulator [Psychromonas sp. CNPT3]|uniref:LysR family transcriptional regulator n=1 Tax=Psychromonas sp. CNPT3 TaxID=314282 RepID=UPI00006E7089|nr:LysR family transcriptional regulator [Psychromonas sp. CNPT3]AGH80050.1 LysR family transcriptional regulator [Psychromonas sp. CNPT3]
MDLMQLSRFSFKHLSTLHVMLCTHSVSKSASILCITPSSVSKTLAQLRTLLNDELFYREGRQLIATPYALHIAPSVHIILNNMNTLIHQRDFNAEEFQGTFRLSMRASTFDIFAPSLCTLIEKQAPNAQLEIHSRSQRGFDALLSGQVDVIILPHDKSQPPSNEKQLCWQTILDDEMICVMQSNHPLADKTLTIENYLAYKHIAIFDKELQQPYFEQLLKQQYQARKIAISVADFGSAAATCQHSHFLFTCSKKWFERSQQSVGLIAKKLPFESGKVVYSMVFNQLASNDPALNWLLQNIKTTLISPIL